MKMTLLSALLLLPTLAPAPADAGAQRYPRRGGDQDAALEARRSGRLLPLREIERRIVPLMPGAQYIGFDFDSASGIYTLKFLRNGSVIWVAVDGANGAIVGRRGQ